MRETDLFPPLKTYLEGQGYKVASEVKGCDIVARKGEEMIIIEMKTRFSLALVYQGIKRREVSDSVYLAVPLPAGKRTLPNLGNVKHLLRRLGLGLLQVRFLKTKTLIEPVLHPGDYEPYKKHKKQRAILREIDSRYAELDIAGSPNSGPRMTAYRQEALVIARILSSSGSLSPGEIRKKGTGNKTQRILSSNLYGWFIREKRGVYSLSREGIEALERFPKLPNPPG